METLAKLFGSAHKVKIMRLFLLNPGIGFEVKDIAQRSMVSLTNVRRELVSLITSGFIKKRTFSKLVVSRGKKRSKKVNGFVFNDTFTYRDALYNLLLDAEFIDPRGLEKKFSGAGKLNLLLASGVFMQDRGSRVDLLIVGTHLKKNIIDRQIRLLEAEIGKELTYATFETPDFLYRANMYDKLIREIVDYPYILLKDNGVLNQVPQIS
jgi:hypothetical protein